MNPLIRRPAEQSEDAYDLIVVGGGIHGACLLHEAARCGVRALLLERDDFGGATSWNSLRIVHGGLRYLQSLDLPRFRESIRERRWYLRRFPHLVRPLGCLMPLYGGMRRPSIFRVAAAINEVLSRRRNDGVRADAHLPAGGVVDADRTVELFPAVDRAGLLGGGIWHDALILSPQRIVIELLRSAASRGAVALNYVEADELIVESGAVRGMLARDRVDAGGSVRFTAPVVVNTAGPWMQQLAERWAGTAKLASPAIAFNLLLAREPLSSMAVAVGPRVRGGRTYFLVPWRGRIMAGTYHAPWSGADLTAAPASEHIEHFIDDLNQAVPGLELERSDVLCWYAGIQPARGAGDAEPSVRDVHVDHARRGGPAGLHSVAGIKYTTARAVARKTLRQVLGRDACDRGELGDEPLGTDAEADLIDPAALLDGRDLGDRVRRIVAEEAVEHLDDLVLRRTDWGADPEQAVTAGEQVCELLGWTGDRQERELARLRAQVEVCTVTMT